MYTTLRARLTKKEKALIIKEIREREKNKIVSISDPVDRELQIGWNQLRRDHLCRLESDLRHVADIHIKDILRGDALGEEYPSTAEIFTHYQQHELQSIARDITEAEAGLSYLKRLIDKEIARRSNDRRRTV